MPSTPVDPSFAGWLNRNGSLANWVRVIGAASAAVAAGAIAWSILTGRVQAAELTLGAHSAQLREHEGRLRSVEGGQRDTLWMLHEMCIRQAQQMGTTDAHCRRPPETR